MVDIFTPGNIGSLELPNRLIRSATAERMAGPEGRPRDQLVAMYRALAAGGVGLIITGHMYIHPSGKCHPEMTGVYSDELIPDLARLAQAVHVEGGKIVVQINHGGMQCSTESVRGTVAPSAIDEPFLQQPARELRHDEILGLIDAYAHAARRVKEAGFDGVQLHHAHGYLLNQFLSPYVNRRSDQWGGDPKNRMRFLREVSRAVRDQVGPDYPVLIKYGMMDGVEGGLSLDESALVIEQLAGMGLDVIELSGGIGGKNLINIRKGIRKAGDEAYFLPLAQKVCGCTHLPVALVGGFRSRQVMDSVLASGDADFISLCRPLISEPDLPTLFKEGRRDKSRCISSNNCWAEMDGVGIACKCPLDKIQAPA